MPDDPFLLSPVAWGRKLAQFPMSFAIYYTTWLTQIDVTQNLIRFISQDTAVIPLMTSV